MQSCSITLSSNRDILQGRYLIIVEGYLKSHHDTDAVVVHKYHTV